MPGGGNSATDQAASPAFYLWTKIGRKGIRRDVRPAAKREGRLKTFWTRRPPRTRFGVRRGDGKLQIFAKGSHIAERWSDSEGVRR